MLSWRLNISYIFTVSKDICIDELTSYASAEHTYERHQMRKKDFPFQSTMRWAPGLHATLVYSFWLERFGEPPADTQRQFTASLKGFEPRATSCITGLFKGGGGTLLSSNDVGTRLENGGGKSNSRAVFFFLFCDEQWQQVKFTGISFSFFSAMGSFFNIDS